MRLSALALAATLGAAALPVDAAPVGLGFNAGPITSISDPSGVFAGFSVGEELFFEFTLDDATPDSNSIPGFGRYRDPAGTLSVTGLTDGTLLTLANGVQFSFNGVAQVEIVGLSGSFGVFALNDGIGLQSPTQFVTDPENLTASLAELQAALTDGLFDALTNISTTTAQVANLPIGALFESRMTFGPVGDATTPVVVAPVPLPAGGVLLLTGLGAAAGLRRATARPGTRKKRHPASLPGAFGSS